MHPGSRVLGGCLARLRFYLDYFNCVEMVALQFYLQSWKHRKLGWVGGEDRHVVFWSKIPWWEGKCEAVLCRDSTASSSVAKVRGEVFAHFHAVAVKRHSSMRNWLFGLPGRILCKQSPWCQKKWWARSWICSSPLAFFGHYEFGLLPYTIHALFPECFSNRRTFSESCTNSDAVPSSDPWRNRIRPDTRLQIKLCKNQHIHPAA
jgi:hypothetical protein